MVLGLGALHADLPLLVNARFSSLYDLESVFGLAVPGGQAQRRTGWPSIKASTVQFVFFLNIRIYGKVEIFLSKTRPAVTDAVDADQFLQIPRTAERRFPEGRKTRPPPPANFIRILRELDQKQETQDCR
jgi:hypothetical protein